MKEIEFESIKTNISATIQRAQVPGGWLVAAVDDVPRYLNGVGLREGLDWRTHLTFVPDPNHTWR